MDWVTDARALKWSAKHRGSIRMLALPTSPPYRGNFSIRMPGRLRVRKAVRASDTQLPNIPSHTLTFSRACSTRQTKRWSRTEECVISFHSTSTTVASGCVRNTSMNCSYRRSKDITRISLTLGSQRAADDEDDADDGD